MSPSLAMTSVSYRSNAAALVMTVLRPTSARLAEGCAPLASARDTCFRLVLPASRHPLRDGSAAALHRLPAHRCEADQGKESSKQDHPPPGELQAQRERRYRR